MELDRIVITGARQHDRRNVSVEIRLVMTTQEEQQPFAKRQAASLLKTTGLT